jgi:hypothetical protein
VLVKSPAFIGECPGVVTAVYGGGEDASVNVHVFTNAGERLFLVAMGAQSESSLGWGWRWPPREMPAESAAAEVSADRERCVGMPVVV